MKKVFLRASVFSALTASHVVLSTAYSPGAEIVADSNVSFENLRTLDCTQKSNIKVLHERAVDGSPAKITLFALLEIVCSKDIETEDGKKRHANSYTYSCLEFLAEKHESLSKGDVEITIDALRRALDGCGVTCAYLPESATPLQWNLELLRLKTSVKTNWKVDRQTPERFINASIHNILYGRGVNGLNMLGRYANTYKTYDEWSDNAKTLYEWLYKNSLYNVGDALKGDLLTNLFSKESGGSACFGGTPASVASSVTLGSSGSAASLSPVSSRPQSPSHDSVGGSGGSGGGGGGGGRSLGSVSRNLGDEFRAAGKEGDGTGAGEISARPPVAPPPASSRAQSPSPDSIGVGSVTSSPVPGARPQDAAEPLGVDFEAFKRDFVAWNEAGFQASPGVRRASTTISGGESAQTSSGLLTAALGQSRIFMAAMPTENKVVKIGSRCEQDEIAAIYLISPWLTSHVKNDETYEIIE